MPSTAPSSISHERTPIQTPWEERPPGTPDRKSTRLNSSHSQISYAVFCLKKKKSRDRPSRLHRDTGQALLRQPVTRLTARRLRTLLLVARSTRHSPRRVG